MAYDDGVIAVSRDVKEFCVVDASDPTNLAITQTYTLAASPGGFGINDNTLYVSLYVTGTTTFEIYDVTNVAVPVYKSSISVSGNVAHYGFKGDYLFGSISDDLEIWDIISPYFPVSVDTFEPTGDVIRDIVIDGNTMHLLTGYDYLTYDITDPTASVLESTLTLFAGYTAASNFDINSQYAFIGTSNLAPQVVDRWPADNPQKILSWDYPYWTIDDTVVWDGHLYTLSAYFGPRIHELY